MKISSKTIKIAGILTVLTVFICLTGCFTSICPEFSGIENIPDGKGAVRISIAETGAKTIFPDMGNFSYVAFFTSGDKQYKTAGFNGTSGVVFNLEAGTWDIYINVGVLVGTNRGPVIGEANLTGVSIVAGQVTECKNVKILPMAKDYENEDLPDGTFSWSVDFPEGLDSAKMFYGKSGADPVILDLLALSITEGTTALQGTISLPPGTYRVRSELKKDELIAGDAEAVHIYSGQTSVISNWIYYETSFIETKVLAGSVSITHSDKITISGVAAELDGIAPVVLNKSGENTYSFSGIQIPGTMNNLTGDLIITSVNNAISIPVDLTYSASLTFDPVILYALSAELNAGGKLKVNDAEKAGIFQMDFLAGTELLLTAIPDENYELDEFLLEEEEYDDLPFIISADTAVAVSFLKSETSTIWEWDYEKWVTAGNSWANLTGGASRTIEGLTVSAKNGPIAAGNSSTQGDGIVLGPGGTSTANVFFMVGSDGLTATVNNVYDTNAVLDFSKPVRISVQVKKLTETLATMGLRFAVNNNVVGDGASVFGTAVMIRKLDSDFTEDTMIFTYDIDLPNTPLTSQAIAAGFDKNTVMAHSFISFCVTSPAQVLISWIKIEYQ